MISPFLNQTMIRERYTENAMGERVLTDSQEYKCRLEVTTVRVAGQNGEYRERNFRIYTMASADIKENDRIIMDTDQAGTGAPDPFVVKSVFQARGFGPSHLEVAV